MNYRMAPEIERIADKLIEEIEDFKRLNEVGIEYVMGDKAQKKAGRETPGKVVKVGGVGALLALNLRPHDWDMIVPDVFVCAVAENWWRRMSEDQRRGLVDHLLSHITYDAQSGWQIVPPEFGEFPEVLKRNGFWRPDETLKDLAATMSEQLSLLPETEQVMAGMDPQFREDLESGRVSVGVNG